MTDSEITLGGLMIGKPGVRRAPYVPFKTFLTALDILHHATFDPVDRDAFPSASGAVQGQILGTLIFFDLIDDRGYRQPRLERLSNPDRRQADLKTLLESYYDFVADDLRTMNFARLRQALEKYRVTGDTADKAKAFFLAAAKYSGLSLPPQLQGQKPRARRKTQTGESPRLALEDLGTTPADGPTQISTATIELANGCRVTLSIEANLIHLAPENRDFVIRLIDDFNSPIANYAVKKPRGRDESSEQREFAELITDPGEKATWEPANQVGRRGTTVREKLLEAESIDESV